ncbi:hypothetical protein MLD38_036940 [Melastoma candidum]|uniref:Uncharacterized protein n=1 Tax=Melastoma candidum TaxID=119954 RepID=A0ACB9LLH7_9MYRT|nr:hypothetical protein MLD38_036940 [Melastoma candidum]
MKSLEGITKKNRERLREMGKLGGMVPRLFLLVLSMSFPMLCSSRVASSGCNTEELRALVEFHASLDYPPWAGAQLHWNGTRCCLWEGVGCNRNGRVVKLDFPGQTFEEYYPDYYYPTNSIKSTVAETLGSLLGLRYLNHLDLSGIECWQPCMIPDVVESMRQLRFLGFPVGVSGNLPRNIGNLTKLQVLVLPGSGLELVDSDIRRLSILVSLNRFDLRNALIPRPSDLGRVLSSLPRLSNLTLSGCGLDNSFLRHISSNFTLMSNLKHLDLSANFFFGDIPDGFQNATALEFMDLSRNEFSSSVPMWFGNYRNLALLSLGDNFLEGIEGGLGWLLSSKKNLRYANLANNELAGEILTNQSMLMSPLYGGDLKNLRFLFLSANRLSGEIPGWLGGLPVLEYLDLSKNQFSGSIPSSLYSTLNLRLLNLNGNQLSGTISEALGQLSNLEHLDLSGNKLSGTVSEAHFWKLSQLSYLDLSDNHLTIKMDDSWTPPFQVFFLGMGSCSLGTQLPRWMRTQKHLSELKLPNVSFSNQLPEWIGDMNLFYLNLSYSRIIGPVPDLPTSLFELDISHSSLIGPLPESIGRLASLINLYAYDNYINGSVPSFLCKMKSLWRLDLSKNNLSGSIPDCWDTPDLVRMDFSFNNLSGPIPSSIKHLNALSSLHLNNNYLSGEIPHGLSYCDLLLILDLGDNNLNGGIPTWMGGDTLPMLQVLRLTGNELGGHIPPMICSFQQVRLLDLSRNGLTGSIPPCFGLMSGFNLFDWSALASRSNFTSQSPVGVIADGQREHVIQFMKGVNSDYTQIALELVTILDLSSNSLVGTLPKELCNLFGLRGLNVSHNHLNGSIPNRIGDMTSIESLDLSDNLLTGNIPASISALTSLDHLNLSHNNLSGEIPKGSQMQTLQDPSIYADNPLLCADFLQRKCHSTLPPGYSGLEDGNDRGDKLEQLSFYAVMALGFGCGFWGAVGSLVVNSKWRKAFFEFAARVTD